MLKLPSLLAVAMLTCLSLVFPSISALTASCTASGSCSCYSGSIPDGCTLDSECVKTNTCTYACPSRSHATVTGNTCTAGTSTCNCAGYPGFPGSCDGGVCSCTISGTCTYACTAGYSDCDGNSANGCECATPSNCCGGAGDNYRYYSCTTCDGLSCTACDAYACLTQACGSTSYCSSGNCLACSGTKNCNLNSGDGCECTPPASCCGGTGSNTRYYSCVATCSGTSCLTCGATACSSQSCGTTSYCSSGSCVACSSGYANCDGNAIDGCDTNLNTDEDNCGACGNSCGSHSICISGSCTCSAGYDNCDDDWDNGCECSTPAACCGTLSGKNRRYYSCQTCDGSSCASCGFGLCSWQECGTASYCSSGSCVSCAAGKGNCDEDPADLCETNLNTDTSNCGSCDRECTDAYGACGYQTCTSGDCGNVAYSEGQYAGCTAATGCSSDGVGTQVCVCDGAGACTDKCGDLACDSWEDITNCPYDCGAGDPTVSSATDYPDPANNGTDVNFTVSWSNPNATEEVKIHICKTGSISGQTCSGGSWCDSSAFALTNPASCNYTTTAADNGTKNYYAYACDPADNCSASTLGTFTVNIAPSAMSASDFPDPVSIGSDITFSVDWDDDNATENVKIHVCKTNVYSGSCTGGSWCDSSSFSGTDPATCSYTALAGDGGTKSYYAFVCDDDSLCSSSVSGSFSVNSGPSVNSVTDYPDPQDAGGQVLISASWSDVNAGEQVKLHACKTNAYSGSCTGGSWCDSSSFSGTSPATCNYTTQIADSGAKAYYAFVCDDDGLCSSSASSSFSVIVTTQNKLLAKLTLDGTSNSVYIPGTGLVAASALGSVLPFYPPQKFITSYSAGALYALARAAGTTVSTSASATDGNHTITMGADISGSKLMLVFTKGDWKTIADRMPLVDSLSFLAYPAPSFAYGLGKSSIISVLVSYTDLDIGNTAVYQKGDYRLDAYNTGQAGGKASINVTR